MQKTESLYNSSATIFSTLTFCVIALLIYACAAYQLTLEKEPLQKRCEELTARKEALFQTNKELSEMVASFADPAADEFALITELGRMPEGYKKIIFNKSTQMP